MRRIAISPDVIGAAVTLALTAAAALALALARPDGAAAGFVLLGVAPLAVLLFAGPARAVTVVAALGFIAALNWAYTEHFAPLFAYTGIVDSHPPTGAKLVVAALAALPALWLPLSVRRPSSIVLWSLYVGGYVPMSVVPLFLKGDLGTVLPLSIALVGTMAILGAIVRLPAVTIRLPHLSAAGFTRLVVALGVATLVYIAVTFGIHPPPSLDDVYGTRAQFATAQSDAPAGGYIVPWAANAINPMLMALGIVRKRFDLVALGLLGQLLIYADTGYKSVFFSLAVVPLVYVAASRAPRSYGQLAVAGSATLLVGSVLVSSVGALSLAESLARRTFATPGHIGYYYYEYFSDHPQYHLSHSFLSWMGSSSYTVDIPFVIGEVYFGSGSVDANSNMWADAYANFGFAGVFVFTLVCGLVLLVMDGVAEGRDPRLFGPVAAIGGLSFASTGVFTTVVTQGVALNCLLIALMPPLVRHWAPASETQPEGETRAGPQPALPAGART